MLLARAIVARRARAASGGVAHFSSGQPSQRTHWMPLGMRRWLDGGKEADVERWWWHRGIRDRLGRDFRTLAGRDGEVRELLQYHYDRAYERHRHRLVDNPSESHLRRACLVLATYRTLLPWANNDSARVMEMIREQSGDVTAGAVHALVRVSLWLSGGPYELMVRGMLAMQHDYGRTFTFEQPQSPPGEHRMHVTRCFFHDMFASEGVPHLTQCCCCSVDKLWFESLDAHRHGVKFELVSRIAKGDARCALRLVKADADAGG